MLTIFRSIFVSLIPLLFPVLMVYGREPVTKISTGEKVSFIRLENEGEDYRFEAHIETALLEESSVDTGFISLLIEGFHPGGKAGSPALPFQTVLFEAGAGGTGEISLLALDSVVVDLKELGISRKIVPAMPAARKNNMPGLLKADSTVYGSNQWTGGEVLRAEYQGRMRGLDISALYFSPVRYNPAKDLLVIYQRVEALVKPLPAIRSQPMSAGAFSSLFNRVVRKPAAGLKAVRSEEPLTLVILSDTLFREALAPLVAWKTRKGFRVVEAYRQDSLVGGTGETIKNYLHSLYEQPPEGIAPPSYLLIVGDVEQIPVSQSTGEVTDLYYAEYDGGGDYIPELFYGRISVTSPGQLEGIVQKILEYEQYGFADASFLNRTVLIAGVDETYASTFGNGQINYAHDLYLNEGSGFNTNMFRYPESDTSAKAIFGLVSSGAGLVNYTGHGQWDRWIDPPFTRTDVDSLKNSGCYPVVIANGCETNYFLASECLAEAFIRAKDKGALAYIGCTNDSYWQEDFYWAVGVGPVSAHPLYEESSAGYFDRVFHTHNEPFETWTPSLGEMLFGGNLSVQESLSPRKKFYWEIYQLAGDPTIVPWFGNPPPNPVLHPVTLPPRTGRIDLSCAPNSYLAVSDNGKLLDAGHANGDGTATLQLPDTLTAGKLDLVVTAEGYRPYTAEISIQYGPAPYLDLYSAGLTLESVEEDMKLTPSEEASYRLVLINRGGEPVEGDTLILYSLHPSVMVTDSLCMVPYVAPGDSLEIGSAFRILAGTMLEDQAEAMTGIRVTGTGITFYVKEDLASPVLVSRGFVVDDRPRGNGNGIIEPGESLLVSWMIGNTGHFRSGEITAAWQTGNHEAIDTAVFANSLYLEPGESNSFLAEIFLGEPTQGWYGTGALEARAFSAGIRDSFRFYVGAHYEDFRTGLSGRLPFRNESAAPWLPDSGNYASPFYSLRSGKIGHGGSSRLTVSFVSSADDSLTFSCRVSSEYGFDFLILEVDSVQNMSWSGETDWRRHSLFLEAGNHTLSWVYRKDQNTNRGEDAAWIDDISFPAGAFTTGDLSLDGITAPVSGPWLSENESLALKVTNHSADRVNGFTVRISINGRFLGEGHVDFSLDPGSQAEVPAGISADFSELGLYKMEAVIISDTLAYAGNNMWMESLFHYTFPDLALSLADTTLIQGVSAGAIVSAENMGNIPLDSLTLEVVLNGDPVRAISSYLSLEPGENTELSVPLIDSTTWLPPGQYLFVIRSTQTDSVEGNQEVTVPVDWMLPSSSEEKVRRSWTAYPNPVCSELYVRLDRQAETRLDFHLYDMSGRMISTVEIQEGAEVATLPVGDLRPGLYLLRQAGAGKSVRITVLPGPNH